MELASPISSMIAILSGAAKLSVAGFGFLERPFAVLVLDPFYGDGQLVVQPTDPRAE